MTDVISDLLAEGGELEKLVAGMDKESWALETPARGWTIAHQFAHMAATFRMAALAASDGEAFTAMTSRLSPDFDANVAAAMRPYLAEPPDVLLDHWRTELTNSAKALAAVPAGQTVPWLVRPLPPSVLAAAGMMELFGHGQDVYDTLGARREPTDRLGHLVFFGSRTWDFGYLERGLPVPERQFRFEITAPSGTLWTFGPEDNDEKITGPALDFCLLVTRRRHPDDLALTATGDDARFWLTIAQAYRGPSGPGRQPGQFD
jgi:uncharacterized protein (TIGR03084 family)